MQIDDVVEGVQIHLCCGVWSLIAPALFSSRQLVKVKIMELQLLQCLDNKLTSGSFLSRRSVHKTQLLTIALSRSRILISRTRAPFLVGYFTNAMV